VLSRHFDSRQRLPRLRGRARRLACVGSRVLAKSGAGHADQDGFRTRALEPPPRSGVSGLLSGCFHGAFAAGYMQRYGADPQRFGSAATHAGEPAKIDNELYVRDYAKCILCYKCVEACGVDAQNTFAISIAGRGFSAHIAAEFDAPLPESACVYCGNCIGVCPTGALMFKTEYDMRKAGTWRSRDRLTQTPSAHTAAWDAR